MKKPRVVFLLPTLGHPLVGKLRNLIGQTPARRLVPIDLSTQWEVSGGTLNIMRQCALVRSLGYDACLATRRGTAGYGRRNGCADIPCIKWGDRRPDDLCVVPDTMTARIDEVEGTAIAYLQSPRWLRRDFDYMRPGVVLWTDSPFMVERCREVFPDKEPVIVPNIVDAKMFPFIAQGERTQGLLFVFPRKGADFIEAVLAEYHRLGGDFWRPEFIDGLTIHELAQRFREPQAFLASADVEGCALPPQECMAAGVVVVGKTAKGANFCMQHKETAMVGNTPSEAAYSLREIEDIEFRESLAEQAHQYIQRFFPEGEPSAFWREFLAAFPGPPESKGSAVVTPGP